MTTFIPTQYRNNPWFGLPPTRLQQVILDRARGTVKNQAFGPTEITATLNSVSEAVESAFVLTPRAAAEKAKLNARLKRLDELADEHFEEYFEDLGPKKTSAIEEIYRLEQEVKERTPYDERDAA